MKKTIIFFVFALGSLLFYPSCSSDNNSSDSISLVGKWNFSKMSTVINGAASPETDYEGNESGCPKDFVVFKLGDIYNEGDYDGTACILDTYVGTWVKNGNVITITEGNEVFSAEIVSLTSSVLKVKATETASGVTVTVNITFTKA